MREKIKIGTVPFIIIMIVAFLITGFVAAVFGPEIAALSSIVGLIVRVLIFVVVAIIAYYIVEAIQKATKGRR